MVIDPKTLMFSNIPAEVAKSMYQIATAIVSRGLLPAERPAWLRQWLETCGFSDNQFLLIASTVLPIRIFASLLNEHSVGDLCS